MTDQPKPAPPIDNDTPPPSHEHTNQPGMTNGVPDQASGEEAKGTPENGRHEAETGPAKPRGRGPGT